MMRSLLLCFGAAALLLWSAASAPAQPPGAAAWGLPPFDTCQPQGGLHAAPGAGEDATPLPFKPGDAVRADQLPLLRGYFPPQLWGERDKFFYEGMRMQIGPCFADYGPPGFWAEASRRFRGKARLLDNGGIEDYTAGEPFAPEQIDPADSLAGLRWAWNVALRYQGGGFFGKFRISDMVGRSGRAEPFEGEIFKVQLAHRADRAGDGYAAPGSKGKFWVAGGQFTMPFDAREYAWRQYRDLEQETKPIRSDDLYAYIPQMRRTRRISGADVEGLYMPSFSVGVVQNSSLAIGGGAGEAGGVGAASVGTSGGTITTKRSGFEGLEIRPLLYDWKVLGLHDVLAPINSTTPSYPEQTDREFGPWGLSFASDTWDLRRALVLEGRAKGEVGGDQVARQILYVDLQTRVPLYYLSFDSRDEPIDVGVYVGRWSETRDDYPKWPQDASLPARVIDPVGAAFANLSEGGGWRRESWTVISIPPDDGRVQRMLSVGQLTKRR
jgi:Protein of unknown function (DUF1329)